MKNPEGNLVIEDMTAFDKLSCEDIPEDDFDYYESLSEEERRNFDDGWNEAEIERDLRDEPQTRLDENENEV